MTSLRCDWAVSQKAWGRTQRSRWRAAASPSCSKGAARTWTWSPALRRRPGSGSTVWRKRCPASETSPGSRRQNSILYRMGGALYWISQSKKCWRLRMRMLENISWHRVKTVNVDIKYWSISCMTVTGSLNFKVIVNSSSHTHTSSVTEVLDNGCKHRMVYTTTLLYHTNLAKWRFKGQVLPENQTMNGLCGTTGGVWFSFWQRSSLSL